MCNVHVLKMQVENSCQYDIQNIKSSSPFENDDWPGELKEDIKRIIKNEGFIKYSIKIKRLPVTGGNYLATLYEIDISGKTKEGGKEINIFVKQLERGSGDFTNFMDVSGAYNMEKFAYSELRPVFEELQENAKVPIDERYKMVKCYESNPTSILMDNLCKRGYKVCSRIDVVTFDYADLAIKNLAKFHALSFVIEKHKPELFESRIKTLKWPLSFTEHWVKYEKRIFSIAMSNLEDDLRNRVEDTLFKRLHKYCEYYECPLFKILCHGDYRVMNIMIKESEDEIKDMMPLDYQLLNYGNPLVDVMYFIFTATDREFRKKHLVFLKDRYFQTISDFLKYFDMDIEDSFPRKCFENLYEETLEFGIIILVTLMPILLADDSDVPDIANATLSDLHFKVHDNYKRILRDGIEDFIEWGYL